jgi:hypothetical protein
VNVSRLGRVSESQGGTTGPSHAEFRGGGGRGLLVQARTPNSIVLRVDEQQLTIGSEWTDIRLRASKEAVSVVTLTTRGLGTKVSVRYRDSTLDRTYFATLAPAPVEESLLRFGWSIEKRTWFPLSLIRRFQHRPTRTIRQPPHRG